MPLTSAAALDAEFDVCVIGAGPAGLACALNCHDRGLKVLVLEAGGERPVAGSPDLLSAEIVDSGRHDPTELVAASALGGTSHWWGGRTVPFDQGDFDAWPIQYGDLQPWYDKAAEFLGVRSLAPSPPPGAFARLSLFDATPEEALAPRVNMAKRWRHRLITPNGPAVVLGARVVGLVYEAGNVTAARVRVGGRERLARAQRFVLACGGLGGLKLLLLLQREHPSLLGGAEGPLGRNYMGHLTGAIADLSPVNVGDIDRFCFRRIEGDFYARRQIHARAQTAREHAIGHIGFWLDNASNEDPAHGSALASAKYVLARALRRLSPDDLSKGHPLGPHFDNIARAPVTAATGLVRLACQHLSARMTGRLSRPRRFVQVREGAWHMRYHAEQRPDPTNRIRLSDDRIDSVGLPSLRIDFRYSDDDVDSVVRAHELLDQDLAAAGAGRLRWRGARDECVDMVREAARDGYHQLGGAAMSRSPREGVVDPECRAFGVDNLWVASSSVFPTGGQANPTLTVVAIACRLADRLAMQRAAAA